MSIAKIGDIEKRRLISRLKVTASWDGCSAPRVSDEAIVHVNPGWILKDHEVEVHASNNGSRSIDVLPGGLEYISQEKLKEAIDDAIDIAASAGDDELKAKIDRKYKHLLDQYQEVKTNKNILRAQVSAKPHGWCLDRKRGWEEISVYGNLMYVGKDKEDVYVDIEDEFGVSLQSLSAVSGARKILVEGQILIKDDETWSSDKYGYLTLEESNIVSAEDRDHTLLVTSKCIGGEVRLEINLDASLGSNGAIQVAGEARLYEGTNCNTTDLDDKKLIVLTVPKDQEVKFNLRLTNNEWSGKDWAQGKITFSNKEAFTS